MKLPTLRALGVHPPPPDQAGLRASSCPFSRKWGGPHRAGRRGKHSAPSESGTSDKQEAFFRCKCFPNVARDKRGDEACIPHPTGRSSAPSWRVKLARRAPTARVCHLLAGTVLLGDSSMLGFLAPDSGSTIQPLWRAALARIPTCLQ